MMTLETPTKKPYPFGWPGYRPGKEGRKPKRKPARRKAGLTGAASQAHNSSAVPHERSRIGVREVRALKALNTKRLFLRPESHYGEPCAGSCKTGRTLTRYANPRTVRHHLDWRRDVAIASRNLSEVPMNTPNTTSGEIRPNSTAALSDEYDRLVCRLEQVGAILRLLIDGTQDGTELPPHMYPALCGAESLFSLADVQYSRLCDAGGRGAADSLLQTGCLLDQCRAVGWLLNTSLSSDEPPACKVFEALCALDSLLKLARAELSQAWSVLALDGRGQDGGEGSSHGA